MKYIASAVHVIAMLVARGFLSIWLFAAKTHDITLLEHITWIKSGAF